MRKEASRDRAYLSVSLYDYRDKQTKQTNKNDKLRLDLDIDTEEDKRTWTDLDGKRQRPGCQSPFSEGEGVWSCLPVLVGLDLEPGLGLGLGLGNQG